MTGRGEGGDGSLGADERAALIAAHERQVAALRNSPQYRVGELVIESVRSPRLLARLPVALWRLRKSLLAQHRVGPIAAGGAEPPRDVVVATLLGERSAELLVSEWRQHQVTADLHAARLAAIQPALLFVEAAWAATPGLDALDPLLRAAESGGVPSVFWDNDDSRDTAAATRFDWVFTTDVSRVDRLVAIGQDRVASLPFGAQPRLHNPIGAPADRLPRACVVRGRQGRDGDDDTATLLRAVGDAGLVRVVDASSPASALVEEYRRAACLLHVDHAAALTTCPPCVFEALACRTPVVAAPSPAIEELLGDVVVTVDSAADAVAAVQRIAGDADHRDRIGQLGYRAVMSRHTYRHRVDEVLQRVGIAAPPPPPRVTVLAPTNRPEYLDRLLDNFSRQRDVDADLVVLTNSSRFDRHEVDRRVAAVAGARAIHLAEGMTMGECLNNGLDATSARFIAKFDDDDHYGAHFLHDSLLVHHFVDAAIVGKKTFYAYLEAADETVLRFPGNEFASANRVSGSTMLIDRDVLGDFRFAALNLGEDIDLCERALARGLVVFSADRFNYVAVRRRDPHSHSWPITADDYRQGSVRVAGGLAFDSTMV